ncbi:helix-turn-helix domain-containing protein [Actinokineospora soli]|uniref:Helix-turn-helix domain-containing protein n=1 Tax=Actinokineospora soli TaxID=1048753 RepID=A0ABW2TEZ5_9PSEU
MSKDWQAVADAINARLDELEMTQKELADRSGVSVATLRQLQKNDARGSAVLARWPRCPKGCAGLRTTSARCSTAMRRATPSHTSPRN